MSCISYVNNNNYKEDKKQNKNAIMVQYANMNHNDKRRKFEEKKAKREFLKEKGILNQNGCDYLNMEKGIIVNNYDSNSGNYDKKQFDPQIFQNGNTNTISTSSINNQTANQTVNNSNL